MVVKEFTVFFGVVLVGARFIGLRPFCLKLSQVYGSGQVWTRLSIEKKYIGYIQRDIWLTRWEYDIGEWLLSLQGGLQPRGHFNDDLRLAKRRGFQNVRR